MAAALRSLGQWQLDGAPRRFDAEDWWYRLDFQAPEAALGESLWLGFDGLATVADVWLNDEPLLSSSNMFVAHAVDVGARMRRGSNTLMLRFQALDSLLMQKRARPRWRAPMIEQQQLRWWRTTVLGRTPGWSPPAAVVGPWKDVWLELRRGPVVGVEQLQATLAGSEARVNLRCTVEPPPGRAVAQVWLEVSRDDRVHRAALSAEGADFIGTVDVPDAALWWPHTHGEPARYRCRLQVMLDGADAPVTTELTPVGFRRIELDTTGGRLAMRVNGVPVFCRGACWAPLDAVTLRATPQASRDAVLQARDAGMNMLRVGGTMVYEDAAFFDACDELGMLVWQEFMFANLDYPEHDAAFMASIETEVRQQLALWQGRPSLAVLCGNSEVEQQAAMWGAPRELWQPALFHTTLPRWVNESLPGVPYWPSSAHGGSFPHQGNAGSTSYYGVGAYLRPLEDARRSALSFATECLAFANVPEDATVARMPGGHALKAHHAAWKMRAPRDLGAGWDFEDVRDHYLALLYRVEPARLRAVDHDRYLALSRAVTGEVMSAAFAEWRRPGSRCGGALVWTLRDLWAGAGWGLLDDTGLPKACFHYLRRALQPVALSITDEGCNGLALHLVNERSEALDGALELALYGPGDVLVTRATRNVRVEPRGGLTLAVGDWLDGFLDVSYAYRFGPPPATLVVASLQLPTHADPIQAFHFPDGLPSAVLPDLGLRATAEAADDGGFVLTVETARFAQTVHIESDSHACDDNDFHMAPASRRRIALRSRHAQKTVPLKTSIRALNAERVIALRSPT